MTQAQTTTSRRSQIDFNHRLGLKGRRRTLSTTPVSQAPSADLYRIKPAYVIILAWIHAKNIIASNRRFLSEGGKFIVCCPSVEVIDASSLGDYL